MAPGTSQQQSYSLVKPAVPCITPGDTLCNHSLISNGVQYGSPRTKLRNIFFNRGAEEPYLSWPMVLNNEINCNGTSPFTSKKPKSQLFYCRFPDIALLAALHSIPFLRHKNVSLFLSPIYVNLVFFLLLYQSLLCF